MKVIVIIPAAGLGTRMTSASRAGAKLATPSKQFADLQGAPVLVHTLRKFAAASQVKEIYVALRKSEMDSFKAAIAREDFRSRVRIVEGGEHRQDSVSNALAQVHAADDDILLVHDAVRPFVDQEIIDNVIHAAAAHGAAIAAVPAVDTVKQVERTSEGAIVGATIPREKIVLTQTPQGFRFSVLKKAFDEAAADGFVGTDESSLVERSGHEVAVVMGSARNIKITTPADMELADFFLSQENRRRTTVSR